MKTPIPTDFNTAQRKFVLSIRRDEYRRALRSGVAVIKYQVGKHFRYWEIGCMTFEKDKMEEIFQTMRIAQEGKYISSTFRTWVEIEGLENPDEVTI